MFMVVDPLQEAHSALMLLYCMDKGCKAPVLLDKVKEGDAGAFPLRWSYFEGGDGDAPPLKRARGEPGRTQKFKWYRQRTDGNKDFSKGMVFVGCRCRKCLCTSMLFSSPDGTARAMVMILSGVNGSTGKLCTSLQAWSAALNIPGICTQAKSKYGPAISTVCDSGNFYMGRFGLALVRVRRRNSLDEWQHALVRVGQLRWTPVVKTTRSTTGAQAEHGMGILDATTSADILHPYMFKCEVYNSETNRNKNNGQDLIISARVRPGHVNMTKLTSAALLLPENHGKGGIQLYAPLTPLAGLLLSPSSVFGHLPPVQTRYVLSAYQALYQPSPSPERVRRRRVKRDVVTTTTRATVTTTSTPASASTVKHVLPSNSTSSLAHAPLPSLDAVAPIAVLSRQAMDTIMRQLGGGGLIPQVTSGIGGISNPVPLPPPTSTSPLLTPLVTGPQPVSPLLQPVPPPVSSGPQAIAHLLTPMLPSATMVETGGAAGFVGSQPPLPILQPVSSGPQAIAHLPTPGLPSATMVETGDVVGVVESQPLPSSAPPPTSVQPPAEVVSPPASEHHFCNELGGWDATLGDPSGYGPDYASAFDQYHGLPSIVAGLGSGVNDIPDPLMSSDGYY